MKNIIEWIKANLSAEPFNIYTGQRCSEGEARRYWICNDGNIYYGTKWLIFFKSVGNEFIRKKYNL